MQRHFATRSSLLIVATTAVLMLTACGSNGSTSNGSTSIDHTGAVSPAVTDSVDSTGVPATDSSSTAPTTVKASTAATVVDPALDTAIADVETLLGKNDQDLKDAAAAAANGG
ncbi:unannotated protein [freshwater metagenome]|uniref:Unannotated protein n=1 Tax=freshwater metagenome TaxID=449393 RepID=A0A6J7JJB6_9ZZZZ